jgi:hypothetical protein
MCACVEGHLFRTLILVLVQQQQLRRLLKLVKIRKSQRYSQFP